MVCRKDSGGCQSEDGSVPVYLNVYDLTPINGYAYWLGLGVYHSGLQVHGVEYAFGAHEFPTTGIFEGEPKQCEGFTFRKAILMGWTQRTAAAVRGLMEELATDYRGNAYNLIAKNCNHFCNHACLRLTGNPIPRWVNRLARIGFMCNCVLPATINSTRIQPTKTEDKLKLRSRSDLLTLLSNSSPASSPSTALTRSRSRSRGSKRGLPSPSS